MSAILKTNLYFCFQIDYTATLTACQAGSAERGAYQVGGELQVRPGAPPLRGDGVSGAAPLQKIYTVTTSLQLATGIM
jgi:hypothetical protein